VSWLSLPSFLVRAVGLRALQASLGPIFLHFEARAFALPLRPRGFSSRNLFLRQLPLTFHGLVLSFEFGV